MKGNPFHGVSVGLSLELYKMLVASAAKAAKEAEAAFVAKHGEQLLSGARAWIEVHVDSTDNQQFKDLIAVGFREDFKSKRLSFGNTDGLRAEYELKLTHANAEGVFNTQSRDVGEEGARAFARIFKEAGLEVFVCGRRARYN